MVFLYNFLVGILLMITIALGGVKFEKTSKEVSDKAGEKKIVAYRGASKFAPENTIAALKKAWEMGADYAEIININEDNFSPEYVKAIHDQGMETFRATSDRKNYKRCMQQAIAAGTDYILADNLDVLISLMQKANESKK